MEQIVKNPLKKEIVFIRPVRRKGGWLAEITQTENHDGAFLYTGSWLVYKGIVRHSESLIKIDPLTDEERDFFESPEGRLGFKKGDLDINKRENNYWDTFEVRFDKFGGKLDLNNPLEYLKYKFILTYHNVFAKDKESIQGTHKFYCEVEGDVVNDINKKAERKAKAYIEGASMIKSTEKMRRFLSVYGKRVPETITIEAMTAEVNKIIEKDTIKFLEILEDSDYDLKGFIADAVEIGAIIKKTNRYTLPGGDLLGVSIGETVAFFKQKINSDIKLSIKSQIDNKK